MSSILPTFGEPDAAAVVLAEDVAIPQTVIYSNSAAEKTRCVKAPVLYKRLCAYLGKFTNQSATMVTEIQKEQADSATNNFESIQFNFRYSIPFGEFCEQIGMTRSSGFSTIKNVSSIILSTGAEDSILIRDQIENKYYRIISEAKLNWTDEFGGRIDFTGDSVYTASQVLGVDSDVYIPVFIKRSTEEPAFIYEQYVEGTNALKNVTSYIFGDAFGFVRKINDSFGNLTYMYGYGDKTVNVKADGTLEYKNSALSNGSSNGFYGDLQTAINFASNCGGWSTEPNHPVFKLAFVSTEGSGNNAVHTYYFFQELDGEDIIGESGASLKITVEKGQVSNYVRHAVFATSSYGLQEDVLQAANAIASISEEQSESYADIALNISRIRTCYKPQQGALVPCWCIDFNDGGRTWIGLKQNQF